MRQVRRFWFLALGFCTAIVAYLLTPGQWLNRLVAVALCTVLTTDQVCLPQGMAGRAVAAMPRVEVAQAEAGLVAQQAEDSLMAQRSSEFDDVPIMPAPSNTVTPPPYPSDPGPNFPVRRPDFDGSFDTNNINPINNTNTNVSASDAQFFNVVVSQVGINTFDVKWPSPNPSNCNLISTFERTHQGFYTKSVKFESTGIEACGFDSFVGRLNPQGNRLEIKLNPSQPTEISENTSLIAEVLTDESIRIYYKQYNSTVEIGTFRAPKVHSKKDPNLFKSLISSPRSVE